MLDKIKGIFNKQNIIYIVFSIYLLNIHIEDTVLAYNYKIYAINKILRYICYTYFAIKIFIDWKNGKSITWMMLISVIFSLIICLCSRKMYLLLLLLMLIALKDYDLNKLINISYYVNLFMLTTIILSSIMGILPDWTYLRDNQQLRYSLGYQYPTIPATYFFLIVTMRFYIKKQYIPIIEIFIYMILAFTLYKFTDSKTGFILTLLVIASMFIVKFLNRFKKKMVENKYFKLTKIKIRYICYAMPLMILILIVLLIVLFNFKNTIAIKINDLLSGRLYYANEALKNYDITLFGEDIDWHGWGGYGYIKIEDFSYNFVDIAFMKMLFDYGLITLVSFIVLYTFSIVKYIKEKDYFLTYILILLLIWSLIEPNILDIGMNTFIISFSFFLNIGEIKQVSYKRIKSIITKR